METLRNLFLYFGIVFFAGLYLWLAAGLLKDFFRNRKLLKLRTEEYQKSVRGNFWITLFAGFMYLSLIIFSAGGIFFFFLLFETPLLVLVGSILSSVYIFATIAFLIALYWKGTSQGSFLDNSDI